MQKVILLTLSSYSFVGCSTREEPANEYDEYLEERERQNSISELYREKETAYTKGFVK